MILQRLFSRHTPKNLKKYAPNTDEEIDQMSRGQRLRALEEEDNTARSNTNAYAAKKALKYAKIGAGAGVTAGATIGAIGGPKGAKVSRALAGGAYVGALGALGGGSIGSVRGQQIADKEGHNPDKRTRRLARRMDERARRLGQNDDYEYSNNARISNRKTREAAERAAYEASMARIENRYYHY